MKHFGGASPKLTMVKFPYFNQIFKLMVEWEIFHWDTKMNIQLTGHKNEHTMDRITLLKTWEQVDTTCIEACIYHHYYDKIPNVHTLLKF